MRARMALSISGQPYEIREVLLSQKPIELVKLSSKSTVPVMQLTTGEVLEQSLDIMCWALKKNDPYNWLNPENGSLNDIMDLIKEGDENFKFHLDRYKYSQRYENVDSLFHRTEGSRFLKLLNRRLSRYKYLFGLKPSLPDYAIVPFVRQFANTERIWFDSEPYSSLHVWLHDLLTSRVFISVMKKYSVWHVGDKPIIYSEKSAG
jgi:glutathione S-transferase